MWPPAESNFQHRGQLRSARPLITSEPLIKKKKKNLPAQDRNAHLARIGCSCRPRDTPSLPHPTPPHMPPLSPRPVSVCVREAVNGNARRAFTPRKAAVRTEEGDVRHTRHLFLSLTGNYYKKKKILHPNCPELLLLFRLLC